MKSKICMLSLLLFVASGAQAEKVVGLPSQSDATKAVIGIGVDANQVGKRVCYYQDQAYSLGAILQVGEHYLICQAANKFESNGSLLWEPYTPQQTKPANKH
ncbi:DUF1496 domain-containing protein [Vibrio sinaloensis]|uniref:DUF1496 domain-containing protein n=1 Tax=Photobacterium sp. (strain ATCC 43367) TaxID=379097 RepID=UPI00057D79FB|nr:DUF1496 domain-containing protein [Vibrio sinaloensis]KHT52787.1 hypothetical protein RJ46_00525 [Vibrio sinaloensis]